MSKRIIYHILSGLMAVIASIVLTGCVYDSYDDPDEPTDEDKIFYLTLNIATSDGFGSSPLTRAGNYFYEEPERANEKMNNLHVYIVKEDGTIEASRYVIYNDPNLYAPKSITFKLSRDEKKVYLFANDTYLPKNLKKLLSELDHEVGIEFPASELASEILNRNASSPFFTLDQDIPMCESFEVNLNSDEEGVAYVNADVFVTRIAVKYTFISLEPAETVTVRLNNMATSQYFMPNSATYFPGKYEDPEIINGISGRNITAFTPPQTPNLSTFEMTLTGRTEIELTDDTGNKTKAYRYDPIYLMETPGTSFSMSIKFDGQVENEEEAGIWFPDHILPNLPLLPRNTHVVIYMCVDKYELNCKVDVVPYRGCILEPYFGLQRD